MLEVALAGTAATITFMARATYILGCMKIRLATIDDAEFIEALIDETPKNEIDYAIAETEAGVSCGVMGLTSVNIEPELIDDGDRSVELVSAHVVAEFRRHGVGAALADYLENLAIERGFNKLIVVSGSRNRDAYPFWTNRYGEPSRVDSDYFGAGQERVVWTNAQAGMNQ